MVIQEISPQAENLNVLLNKNEQKIDIVLKLKVP